MMTPTAQLQPRSRRVGVCRREIVRGGRVWSLVVTQVRLTASAPSPSDLAVQMAARYFGSLSSSCAGLVVASTTVRGHGHGPSCGFVLHPTGARHLPLIRLGAPHLESRLGYALLTYPIVGGLLVRTADDRWEHDDSGSFSFEVTVAGASTTFAVRVDDFAARILGGGTSLPRRLLYLGTESPVHRVLVARFLRGFVKSLES